MSLGNKKCVPCEGGVAKLSEAEAKKLLTDVPGWSIRSDGEPAGVNKLYREFEFKNFKLALNFVNKVGEIAENEGHHPDIELGWGYVRITLFTHAIKGLHENDFIVAAKIDKI